MPSKKLRAVADGEVRETPPTLLEAVTAGDVLDMLLAQRRLIAESLAEAQDNTRPQLNNELNKLHGLIRDEEARRADDPSEIKPAGDERFDATAI